MKATKWQRTVSLILCLLMAMSFFVITAPKAYAAEPDWPHLTSVGTPTNDAATKPYFVPVGLREDFTFTVKDIKIEHAESLTKCAVATSKTYTTYDAGTIKFYVDNLPTENDKLEGYGGTDYGFNFQTGNDLVTVKGAADTDTVQFYNLVNLSVANNFEFHSKAYYYIQTADKVRYHYNVQVLQYEDNGEAEPEWPHLTSVGTPTNDAATKPYFVPVGLREDFTFTVKDIKIEHAESLTKCAVATSKTYTTYDAGTIKFYVDNLPTENDKLEGYGGTDYGFNFQTGNDLVTVKGAADTDTVQFYNLVNLSVANNFEFHSKAYYYIQTADKVRYHYNVQVLQYTGEAGEELTLSAGSATRTSKEEASVKFSASAAGNYFYALYDEQQTAPAVDTTSANINTGAMATTNTITISGMTDCRTKYLYIVGVDAAGTSSAPLEIMIPGIPFELKHDKQGLRGFTTIDGSGNITNGWLYTEKFTDASGKTITKAVPGEQVTVNFGVFAIDEVTPLGSVHYDKDADVITDSIGIRQHVLKKWNISGLGEFTTTERSFTFTMPENDVTIQAETELSGVPIQLKSSDANVQATLRCDAQLGSGSGSACYYSDKRDCLVAGASVTLRAYSIADGYVLDKWEITSNGTPVDESKITRNEDGSAELTLEAGGDYVFTAVLREKKFASVTAEVNDSTMGSATVTVGENTGTSLPLVYEGQNVTLTATPGSRYMLERWEVKDAAGNAIDTTAVEDDANKATFVMPSTSSAITAKAFFKVDPEQASTENALTAVELDVPGAAVSRSGSTFTITLPAGTNTSKLSEKILKLTISDFATVTKEGDPDKDWTEGAACGMELDKAATFTVTAEKGNTQTYTIIITKAKSSEKDITAAVLLNQTGDTTPFARAEISETEIIFTLPSDTDKAVLNSIGMKYLKLTYPESATVKMKDGYDDATNAGYRWSNGDVMCNMSINSPVKFTVTAEDGSTKEYTIEIKYTAPAAPTLSDGSATRSSKTAATVKFTTNEAGTYYYKVVTHGATAPTADEIVKSTTKGTASAGEMTFTLSNLTEDARDVYIVVVSAAGGESAPLKVEIPVYGSGTDTPDTGAYKISISAPKGGTITTNRTKADAGDEIIVTVTPDNGYQMVSGSLTYTLATAGGETKTITNGRFTMPAGDVSITCKWETATTTAKGITSFSINGVAGAVNNSTNTITITMPRGTDVTKLTPTISTNGVKSLTPGSGETVNFTNSVNYTATMEDGSTKTYTVTVYVEKGTLSDQFWDKLTDFVNQIPWWEYAKHQQSTSSYPKYW